MHNCTVSSNKATDSYFCLPMDKASILFLQSMLYQSMIIIHGPHFSSLIQFPHAHMCKTEPPCGVRGGSSSPLMPPALTLRWPIYSSTPV